MQIFDTGNTTNTYDQSIRVKILFMQTDIIFNKSLKKYLWNTTFSTFTLNRQFKIKYWCQEHLLSLVGDA